MIQVFFFFKLAIQVLIFPSVKKNQKIVVTQNVNQSFISGKYMQWYWVLLYHTSYSLEKK